MSYQDFNDPNYRGRRFREEPEPSVTERDSFDVDSPYQDTAASNRGYSETPRQYRPQNERYYGERQPQRSYPQNGYRQDNGFYNDYRQERNPQREYYDRDQYSDGYYGEQQYSQRRYSEQRPRQGGYPQYDDRQSYQQRNRYPDDRYTQRQSRQYRNSRNQYPQYDDDYERAPRKKRAGKGAVIARVIMIIALIVALVMIGRTLWLSFDARKAFDQLASLVDPDRQNYQELYNMNSDFFGWIKIDDTVVNYPVMHTPNDPEYYLHTDFDGDYSDSGCLFMDAECNPDGNHYLIYGHHMINGTMFGSLPDYEDYDFYTQHNIIHFDTLNSIGDYEICAVFLSQVYDDDDDVFKYYEYKNLDDEYTFDTYVANVKAMSLYDTGVTPAYGDQLITLSTCNYHTSDGRFVVVAKRI